MHLLGKAWAVAAGATLGLMAMVGCSVGVAGATALSPPSTPPSTPPSKPAVQPAALAPGTYTWYFNGAAGGTITFAPDYTFSSTDSTNDSGGWVEAGKIIALSITGGGDPAEYDCVFVGKVKGTDAIGSPRQPGSYACPGSVGGTFYVAAQSSATRSADPVDPAFSAGAPSPTLVTGKYRLFEGGQNQGSLHFASNDEFTSDVDGDEAGSWVTSGNDFAMTVTTSTSSASNDVGCLYVGDLSSTGINSSAVPAPYVCGEEVANDWWAIEKR